MIDIVAPDLEKLLAAIDQREVTVAGKTRKISAANAVTENKKDGDAAGDSIGDFQSQYCLSSPADRPSGPVFPKFSTPGAILPGVIGGISLLMAFFGLSTLPVNYTGILLIVFSIILFIAEIKIMSHGMLTVGGVISLALGSFLLFETPEPALRLSLYKSWFPRSWSPPVFLLWLSGLRSRRR